MVQQKQFGMLKIFLRALPKTIFFRFEGVMFIAVA